MVSRLCTTLLKPAFALYWPLSGNSSLTDLEDVQLLSLMEFKAGVVDSSEHGNQCENDISDKAKE